MKLLHLFVVLFVGFVCGTAASRCPPKNKVQNQTPKCRDDYDCRKNNQICCPNAYNALSCTYPAPFASLDKSSGVGHRASFKSNIREENSSGKYCNGVKCMPYQVCKPDRYTGKLKCQLP